LVTKEELTYERWSKALGLPLLYQEFLGVLNGTECRLKIMGLRVGGPYKSVLIERLTDKKLYRVPLTRFNDMFRRGKVI